MTAVVDPDASTPAVTTGTLVARRPAGRYHVLTVAAPDVVVGAEPGQFVSVEVAAPGTVLRRPFAIAGVDRPAGLFDIVVAVVGRGTAWLAARPVSTGIGLTGPLGTGFAPPAAPGRCLLVGGGYGVAALVWLAERLRAAGHTVELLSGARSAAALYPAPRPDRGDGRPPALDEVTEDGSRGRTGLVTDVLAERLDGDVPERGGATHVFACGPMPMLAAVARIAARHALPCQVAVEEHMACSVGVCMTCVVPSGGGYVRACIDGPVLDATRIDWAAVGDRPS